MSSVRSRPPDEINETLRTARHAHVAEWRNMPLAERAAMLTRFCDEFEKRGAQIAEELTWQMGRPARYAPNEVRGTLERARHMIAIAPQALARCGRRAQGRTSRASCGASRWAWCSPSPPGTTRTSSP